MGFDRALGDIQIASDLGVVAPLEQEFDNLPLSRPHGAGDLLHNVYLAKAAPVAESGGIGSGRN